jgi:hypothetical protein
MYNKNYFAKIKMAKFLQKYEIIFHSKFPDISITENFRSTYPPNPGGKYACDFVCNCTVIPFTLHAVSG